MFLGLVLAHIIKSSECLSHVSLTDLRTRWLRVLSITLVGKALVCRVPDMELFVSAWSASGVNRPDNYDLRG